MDGEKRLVPEGVSVFDLIMPWKTEVNLKQGAVSDGLSKTVTFSSKNRVEQVDFSKYAHDVQAILINPPWNCTNPLSAETNSKNLAKTGKK